ncbi:transmembrane protein, putative (macronuclear) [Tetrahymena thermophila SB210]|uniref:Transmembrane protein, putative n=1 Tax=Tetrahymena thermophila (strain SB210) TaxID=312017 RepID=Q248A0_TETTS|nr:transmembrane protein, putative [Tetrahymena thermophila SB210]EAS04145.2 transmembrane protein, putative [Tetrahymena thermophila SB210]|eukprot:XP_001024390.2 transmembrane protein, putative [Tetrahymena thermophila SB210]
MNQRSIFKIKFLLIFFIILYIIEECYGIISDINIEGYQIPFCIQYLNAATLSDRDNPNSITLCLKCQKMRVLSSDYKTCLNVREEIVNLKLLNCKRLDYLGQCAEAIDGIEIIDGKYSFTDQNYQNDRCAIASKNYESCLMPRFGYALDIKEQRLYKDHSKYPTFCQLYDSFLEKCIKYFDYFLPSEASNGLSIYLNNFINPHLVDSIVSHSNKIVCVDSNKYFYSLNGCFSKSLYISTEITIHYCKEFLNNGICKQCKDKYALQKNGLSCQKIFIPKCVMYDIIEEKSVCIQCQPFYRIKYFDCILMENCQMLHPLNPNICIACQSPYQLNKLKNICEQPQQQIVTEAFCELYSSNGKCLLCKQNQFNYLFQGYCIPRQKSQFCKNPDPNNDSCLTLECINDTYYAQINSEDFSFNYEQPDIKEIALNNLIKYRLVAQKSFSIFCNKRINYPITNCQIYHPLYESCQKCENNFYMKRTNFDNSNQSNIQVNSSQIDANDLDYQSTSDFSVFICQKEFNFHQVQIQNCMQYSLDGIYCIQCLPGYYEAKKKCIQGIPNCKIHGGFQKCLECEEGFILITYKNDNEVFQKRCEKNKNIRPIQKNDGSFYQQDEPQNAIKSIINKMSFCKFINLGYIMFKSYKICLNDSYLPDCQEGYYGQQNKIICETCRMRFILYNNTCYKDKLYQPIYSQRKLQKITKKCMSVINQQSSGCDTNIQDQIVISQPSIYGETDESIKYNITLCQIKNCQVCEYDRCLKCNQSYKLLDQKVCQKICEDNSKDEECTKEIKQSDDENKIFEKDQNNDNLSANKTDNKQKTELQKQQGFQPYRKILKILLIIAACITAVIIIFYLYRYARQKKMQNDQNSQSYTLFQ